MKELMFFLFWLPSLLLLLCGLLLALPVAAVEGGWQGNEVVKARLISAVTGTGDLATLPLGLEVELAPGWHTYWRMPGDAGAPPQLDWPADANPNLAQTALHFPVPERHIVAGMETIGYQNHVVFPLTVTPKQIGAAMPLRAKLTILACAEQCIPNDLTLEFLLPAGHAAPTTAAALLEMAQARVPQKAGLQLTQTAQDATGILTINFTAPQPLHKPDAFIETVEGSLFQPPQVTLADDKRSGVIRLTPYIPQARHKPLAMTLTLVENGQEGWETSLALPMPAGAPIALHAGVTPNIAPVATQETTQATMPPPLQPTAPASLWLMLWFAFLGGLILNLMPCVLPVLSLKVLKFMGHGGRENHEARQSFLLAAAGILCSFWLIAGVLLAVRQAGYSIGWGIQFQHPVFLGFLIAVLLLFAANLWGWFEINLPDRWTQRLSQAGAQQKALGDFLTGAFAALLATPCTAPFLGTAIGFALGSDAVTVLAIFTGLGSGMALPYLLVALFPGMATRMPRPGKWMVTLRRILAVALLVTAAWLGVTLGEQYSPAPRDTRWRAFAPETIPALVAEQRVVFVDVTASWCLTCQSNKKFVLYQAPVAARLFGGDIVAMQADWTRPDAAIAAYLQGFGRAGIPFNVVYGPAAPQGIILPELLTAEAVMQALDRAGKKE